MLARFQAVVGAGAVYGPFPNGSHVWELRGAAIVCVMTVIWPWLGTVKRTQFEEALASYNGAPLTARAKPLPFVAPVLGADTVSSFGLAWAAGLFDGDGSTCNSARHLKRGVESFGIKASVSQSGPHGVPEVLQRFQSIVGFGQIYGCRWRNSTEPGFDWTIQAYRDVRRLRILLGPLIGPVKVAQMDQALVRFEQSPHRRKSAFRLFPGRSNSV